MSFWDLIRTKSQKTKDEDKDKEYFIKVLKLGILELEKSKVPRKAIIKLLSSYWLLCAFQRKKKF